MRPHEAVLRILGVCLLVFTLAAGASAQTALATLRGIVTDDQHAALPAVTMTARHVETNTSRTVTTDDSGRYFLPNLPAGEYELSAVLQGFDTAQWRGLLLRVGQEATIDFKLKLGRLEQVVTVIGDAAS